jgi:uncharacterized cupin superfamily protein
MRAVIPEAPLQSSAHGRVPSGDGWFVLNAREAKWLDGHFGAYTRFEGEPRFSRLGFNIGVLSPGQPACYYHGEDEQEDFLVLSGECTLLVEGEARTLRAWDFFHSPAGTEHIFVGAGDGPCAILMAGVRSEDIALHYPLSEFAAGHDASAHVESSNPDDVYPDRFEPSRRGRPSYWDRLPWA